MSEIEKAQARFDKKDKRFKIAFAVLIVYAMVMLTVLAVQTFLIQSIIADNQTRNAAASEERFRRYTEDNARQHEVTQQYVLCIAQVLLKPIQQRTNEAFSKCSKTGHYITQSTTPTDSAAPLPQPQPIAPHTQSSTVTPKPEQPASKPATTSAPPPPKKDKSTALDKLPIVGGIFKAVGL